jgi:hypothetical protein
MKKQPRTNHPSHQRRAYRVALSLLCAAVVGPSACGPASDSSAVVDTTPPTIVSAQAIDYSSVDIVFSEELDRTAAEQTTHYVITPQKVAGLTLAYALLDRADPARVHLTFKKVLLPLQYTVTVNGITDPAGNAIAANSAATFAGNGKVAFVTQAAGQGDLRTGWNEDQLSVPVELNGAAAADYICNYEAQRAGLVGDFVAWISANGDSAKSRLGATAGPWIRLDGHPLSQTLDDLLAGRILLPLSLTAGGQAVVDKFDVWTGTAANGDALSDRCGDWGLTTVSVSGGAGNAAATVEWWTAAAPIGCDSEARLYCFQSGAGPALPYDEEGGNLVFVTSIAGQGDLLTGWWDGATVPPEPGSVARGDFICRKLAKDANLPNPDNYKAWLSENSPGGVYAGVHVTETGYAGPWVTLNGVMIAATKADLLGGRLFSAIAYDEKGNPIPSAKVWTGSSASGTPLANYCGSWFDTNSTGAFGQASLTTSAWSNAGDMGCGETAHLYCFED